ncbi:hypothetical protein BT96DRAFT_413298 [Gymnopus androsaceus JB14]|uniref:Uncharacterized protein n=1 Tax=Gymnopus androsaceus JB14 TaxID=1447944 RepID=A0A6A4I444_9AGAR|nr:hypothetical protein BT96DRAFT_413298 [Gymnopus androsaceus JB14]
MRSKEAVHMVQKDQKRGHTGYAHRLKAIWTSKVPVMVSSRRTGSPFYAGLGHHFDQNIPFSNAAQRMLSPAFCTCTAVYGDEISLLTLMRIMLKLRVAACSNILPKFGEVMLVAIKHHTEPRFLACYLSCNQSKHCTSTELNRPGSSVRYRTRAWGVDR